MDSNLLFYGFTTIFYLFCAVKILFNVKKKSVETPFWVLGVTALGVIAHFWVLQSGIFVASHTLALAMGSIISAICFISVLVLLFGSIYGQGSSLLALVLIVAAFGVWAPMVLPPTVAPMINPTPATKIHLALGVVAYSFSFMSAVEMIKTRSASDLFQRFLNAAFIFLTLTLITGVMSINGYFDMLIAGDKKSLLTFVAWVTFGLLVLARKFLSWERASTALLFWVGVCAQVVTIFSFV